MSRSRIAAEEAVRTIEYTKDAPSAKWFGNMINSIGSNESQDLCTQMLERTVQLAKKAEMHKGGIMIAIDKHLIPRHDKNNMLYCMLKALCARTVSRNDSYRMILFFMSLEVMRNPGIHDRTCDQKSKTYPSLYRLTRI